ncbi:MAG: hypothetical protein KKD39_05090 [Candidatus Altiarchaeota archaeon]|nr:hypothetical protein [Candidatus Altiarchaeota archaeon]
MSIFGFMGGERVYTTIGLLLAAFVLVFMSYFLAPTDILHGGYRIKETIYLTIIYTIIILVFYNIYHSIVRREQDRSQTLEAWLKEQPQPAPEQISDTI